MANETSLDYAKFQHEVNKDNVAMELKRPGVNSLGAGILGNFAKDLAESGKGRKRSSAEYAVQGLASGLSAGLKHSDDQNVNKVIDWFQVNNKNLNTHMDHKFKQMEKQERTAPFAQTAAKVMIDPNMNYEQKDKLLRETFKSFQQLYPEDAGQGQYMSLIPDTTIAIFKTPDGQIIHKDIGEAAGKDFMKDQYTSLHEAQRIKIAQGTLNMHLDPNSPANKAKLLNANTYANSWSPSSNYDKKFAMEEAAKDVGFVQANKDRLQILDSAELKLQALKDLFESDKPISGKTLGATAKRLFGSQFNTEAMSDTELMKAITNGLYSYMKDGNTFGNVNIPEFELQTKQAPDEYNTAKGNLKIINYQLNKLNQEREKVNHTIDSFHDFNTKKTGNNNVPVQTFDNNSGTQNNVPVQTPQEANNAPRDVTHEPGTGISPDNPLDITQEESDKINGLPPLKEGYVRMKMNGVIGDIPNNQVAQFLKDGGEYL